MWKAILVLFITSQDAPVSMMMGQFPDFFATKSACEKFIDAKRRDIKGTIDMATQKAGGTSKKEVEIVNHVVSCVEDGTGQPA